MATRQNCWEYKKCGREPGGVAIEKESGICPVLLDVSSDSLNKGKNAGRICWSIAGTFCDDKIQGTFAQKQKSCMLCDFFRSVREKERDSFILIKPIHNKKCN